MMEKTSYSHKSAARMAAVQILYQLELSGGESLEAVEEFKDYHVANTIDEDQDKNINWKLANQLVAGIISHRQELNGLILPALSKDWKFERLELLIRCILQAAIFEIITFPEQDLPVIIAEYLKITEAFYTEKEAKFVNGILHKIGTEMRESSK
jgi:transcription antitermination protein NusB